MEGDRNHLLNRLIDLTLQIDKQGYFTNDELNLYQQILYCLEKSKRRAKGAQPEGVAFVKRKLCPTGNIGSPSTRTISKKRICEFDVVRQRKAKRVRRHRHEKRSNESLIGAEGNDVKEDIVSEPITEVPEVKNEVSEDNTDQVIPMAEAGFQSTSTETIIKPMNTNPVNTSEFNKDLISPDIDVLHKDLCILPTSTTEVYKDLDIPPTGTINQRRPICCRVPIPVSTSKKRKLNEFDLSARLPIIQRKFSKRLYIKREREEDLYVDRILKIAGTNGTQVPLATPPQENPNQSSVALQKNLDITHLNLPPGNLFYNAQTEQAVTPTQPPTSTDPPTPSSESVMSFGLTSNPEPSQTTPTLSTNDVPPLVTATPLLGMSNDGGVPLFASLPTVFQFGASPTPVLTNTSTGLDHGAGGGTSSNFSVVQSSIFGNNKENLKTSDTTSTTFPAHTSSSGTTGFTSSTSSTGSTGGFTGFQSSTSSSGGFTGFNSSTNPTSTTGTTGFTGFNSSTNPTSTTSSTGFTGFNSSTNPTSTTSSTGFTGFNSSTNPTSTTSSTGFTGFNSSTNPTSTTSSTGFTGFNSSTNPTSTTSSTGFTGFNSSTNPTSTTGFTGFNSSTNPTSTTGFTSPTNPTGFTNPNNLTGFTGFQSSTSSTGFTGFNSSTNPTSTTGFTGFNSTSTGSKSSTGFNSSTSSSGYTTPVVTGSTGFPGFPSFNITSSTGSASSTGFPSSNGSASSTGFPSSNGSTSFPRSKSPTGTHSFTGFSVSNSSSGTTSYASFSNSNGSTATQTLNGSISNRSPGPTLGRSNTSGEGYDFSIGSQKPAASPQQRKKVVARRTKSMLNT